MGDKEELQKLKDFIWTYLPPGECLSCGQPLMKDITELGKNDQGRWKVICPFCGAGFSYGITK